MRGRPRIYSTKDEYKKAMSDKAKEKRVIIRERYKIWYDENREILKEKAREYRNKNKDRINNREREWRRSNPDKTRQYAQREGAKKRRALNPILRFKCNTKASITNSFKRNNKRYKKELRSEEILGCSIDFFREYILSKCPEGVILEDFGQFGYHLDHIIPIAVGQNSEEIIMLNHYTNFQPLWWEDNLQKSSKIIKI